MPHFDRAYRLPDLIHLLGFAIIGMFYRSGFGIRSALIILVNLLALMYIFSINNYFDRHHDPAIKNYFTRSKIKKPNAFLIIFLPGIASLLICFFSLRSELFLLVTALIAGTLYSSPPFYLKRVTFIGTFTNPIMFLPFFLMSAGITVDSILISLLFTLYIIIAQIIHERMDLGDDRGFISTARFLGEGYKSALLMLVILFFTFSYILYHSSIINLWFFLLSAALSFVTFALVLISPNSISLRFRIRIVSIIYGAAACAALFIK